MPKDWHIRELTRPERIRPYLNKDRVYTAYALGDLEPTLFPRCRWWLAERIGAGADEEWALLLLFAGLVPPALVCVGEPGGMSALFSQVPLPEQVHLICRKNHLEVAEVALDLKAPRQMVRMTLETDRFRPAGHECVRRLGPDDLGALQALYSVEADAADAFAPYQLMDGVFCGIGFDEELVSAAGTHLVAPTERIGAVGNVYTRPAYRRQGYAAACTSAVCRQLLDQELMVVLNVGTSNSSALNLYQRLGFQKYCVYYEVVGIKSQGANR